MKILLIGPPGSGKSTQARLLAEFLKLPVISTGQIFRDLASQTTEEGRKIKQILDQGKLIDDSTTSKIVEDRVKQPNCQAGFIMDGYPRNIEQVKMFDPDFDKVFYLMVSPQTVLKRLLKRGRQDDTEESISTRLNLYYQQTEPLLEYYKDKQSLRPHGLKEILIEVNGDQEIGAVKHEIRQML